MNRAPTTDWFVDRLREHALVGDVVAPEGAGWQSDDTFVPYVVVAPATATPKEPDVGRKHRTWECTYALTIYGVNRRQVETLADKIRAEVVTLRKAAIDDEYTFTDAFCNLIGGVGYTTRLTPYAYSETDQYALTVTGKR